MQPLSMFIDLLMLFLSIWCHSLVPFIRSTPQNAIASMHLQWHPLKFSIEVENIELLNLVCKYIPAIILIFGFRSSLLRLVEFYFGKSIIQRLAQATIFLNSTFVWLLMSALDAAYGWYGIWLGYAVVIFINVQLLKVLEILVNEKDLNIRIQTTYAFSWGRFLLIPFHGLMENLSLLFPFFFSRSSTIMPLIDTSKFPLPSAPYLPHVLLYVDVDDNESENDVEKESPSKLEDDMAALLYGIQNLDLADKKESPIDSFYNGLSPPAPSVFYAPSAPPLPSEYAHLGYY